MLHHSSNIGSFVLKYEPFKKRKKDREREKEVVFDQLDHKETALPFLS